jgi:flagellin-like protein
MSKVRGMSMRFNKRAQSGIGTLIIFIAMIIVAAVAAGVLIQTAASLQNKALETGTQARGQVTTHVDVLSLSGTDATFHPYLTFFSEVFKLSSGSDPIRVDQTLTTFDTNDFTTNIQYSNVTDTDDYFSYGLSQHPASDIITNSTWVYLRNDLNNDGIQEKIKVNSQCNGIIIDLRNGTSINVSYAGVNLTNCAASPLNCSFSGSSVTDVSFATGASITIQGATKHNCELDENVDVRSASDATKVGDGYYTVRYMQKGSDWQEGYIQKGDVVEMKFASPQDVGEEKKIRINIIPKVGISTPVIVTTPEVMTMQRIYLYP